MCARKVEIDDCDSFRGKRQVTRAVLALDTLTALMGRGSSFACCTTFRREINRCPTEKQVLDSRETKVWELQLHLLGCERAIKIEPGAVAGPQKDTCRLRWKIEGHMHTHCRESPRQPDRPMRTRQTAPSLTVSLMISLRQVHPLSLTHPLTSPHYTCLHPTVASLQNHLQCLPNAAVPAQPPNRRASRPSHSTAPQTKLLRPARAQPMRRRTCSRKARKNK